MTKHEREQVIELLRCAARIAMVRGWDADYRRTCLEAAQRIEEGTWP